MMIGIVLGRMLRAATLDTSVYEEVKTDDTTASGQALVVVLLVSLASGIGAGIAGIFQWAGEWSVWLLLLGLINSIVVWFSLSFLVYLTGTRLSNQRQPSVSFKIMLRTIGFASSPLLLGFFLFIPVIGIELWCIGLIWALIVEIAAVRQVMGFSIVLTM